MDKPTIKPLISVIVPVYNVEPYLRKCIDSIINQTYKNLEIILVDDGSPDNCGAICDEYAKFDNRIKVIHKENGGVSSARNVGIALATGEWISFVDSDDFIDPDLFDKLTMHEADVVVSNSKNAVGLYTINDIKNNYYQHGNFTQPVRKIYKSSIVKNLKFREDIPCGEDIIFNLNVLEKIQNAFFISYDGYHVTTNPNSLTRKNLQKYDYRLDEDYQKKWGEIFEEALIKANISKDSIDFDLNNCSVWIFQKIRNYCFSDCPLSFNEKIRRIHNQLKLNRELVLKIKQPSSPKTHFIIKLCVLFRSPYFTYLIFKTLVLLNIQ